MRWMTGKLRKSIAQSGVGQKLGRFCGGKYYIGAAASR